MTKISILLSIICILLAFRVQAQSSWEPNFSPGFIPQESDALLKLNLIFDSIPAPWFDTFIPNHKFIYRSKDIGLDNSWDLWTRADSTAIILIRATRPVPKSILADFLCTMSPATGNFKLSNGKQIDYKLAEHPNAAVHTGFLLGFGHLADDMKPKIDSLFHVGYRNFIITGHSQGAALSYLVGSWLYYLKADSTYPGIHLKVYASAPPKPGNTAYANDFNNSIGYTWGYSIVNSRDPIPEMPYTTQQTDEINSPNPLTMLESAVKKMPLLKRTVLRSRINKMKKSSQKTSQVYQKHLGKDIADMLKTLEPKISIPRTVNTTNFVTPGTPISLLWREHFRSDLESQMATRSLSEHDPGTYRLLLKKFHSGR